MYIGKEEVNYLQTMCRKSQGVFKNTTRYGKEVYQDHKIKKLNIKMNCTCKQQQQTAQNRK